MKFRNTLLIVALTLCFAKYSKAYEIIYSLEVYDTLKLPNTILEDELKLFRNHERMTHAEGPQSGEVGRKRSKHTIHYNDEIERFGGDLHRGVRHVYNPKLMDQAWTLMLLKENYISRDEARKILTALEELEVGSERNLKRKLDSHHASIPYFGKTMVEPIPRLEIREKILDVIDASHHLQKVLLDQAEKHSETVMPGMTHMAHAQPTTYGAYLLSLHEAISRTVEYLYLAYKHTNINNGGCGATSGSGFPVDRDYISELLGFDGTTELTYDAEPGQDFAMSTLNALSNIVLIISRAAMDFSIWGMDGYSTHLLEAGGSSFMPHKAHAGSEWEFVRISVNNILGAGLVGMLALNKEPYMDNLTIYQAAYRSPHVGTIGALTEAEMLINIFAVNIENLMVDKEKLLQYARDGWGATTDLVAELVLNKGFEVRQAHRVCAVMVRVARVHRKIKPYELTGEMLDEAAELSNDPKPNISTDKLRDIMDPAKFVARHNNSGEPNPKETIRMIKIRQELLNKDIKEQVQRRDRVNAGLTKLRSEIDRIIN